MFGLLDAIDLHYVQLLPRGVGLVILDRTDPPFSSTPSLNQGARRKSRAFGGVD
jgi:hypothetical protein